MLHQPPQSSGNPQIFLKSTGMHEYFVWYCVVMFEGTSPLKNMPQLWWSVWAGKKLGSISPWMVPRSVTHIIWRIYITEFLFAERRRMKIFLPNRRYVNASCEWPILEQFMGNAVNFFSGQTIIVEAFSKWWSALKHHNTKPKTWLLSVRHKLTTCHKPSQTQNEC